MDKGTQERIQFSVRAEPRHPGGKDAYDPLAHRYRDGYVRPPGWWLHLEMGATPKRARAKAAQNLEKVYTIFPRLKERATQKSGTMSGGEQQMLAVARGIMGEPEILMIDELSLGLAPVLTLDLFQSLRRLRNEGLTIMLVEQNVRMALKVSDYAYVLSEGKTATHGPSREVENDASVQAAYLGI